MANLPTFNVNEIAALSAEEKARNVVKQLRHEANVNHWPFAYRGRPVIRWQELPRGIKLLCGGLRGRQWAQVIANENPIGPKFRLFGPQEESAALYSFLMECADRLEAESESAVSR